MWPTEQVAEAIREVDFYAKRPDHYYKMLARAAINALQPSMNKQLAEAWSAGFTEGAKR